VVLTAAGKLYLSHVKKALDELSAAKQKVASFSNNTSLSLVVLPTFGSRWLIPRLSQFQSKYPWIMIHLTARQRPDDFPLGVFDAAIFNERYSWPGTIVHHLMDEDVLAVCSPKLRAKRAIKAPADITKFPLLHATPIPNQWAELLATVRVWLDGPLPGHAYQNYAMLAQAAIDGLGIALLPRYIVEEAIADKQLEIVADQFLDLKTSYHLILPEAPVSEPVQMFADWLIAEARKWATRTGRSANGKSATRRLNGGNSI
jgi:LysR family transcriptional regulator, glycine cleavage system transcriptional activator